MKSKNKKKTIEKVAKIDPKQNCYKNIKFKKLKKKTLYY